MGSGVRPEDTAKRIAAAALEQFMERGYERTSMQAIADAVGLTKAALYYHFPSKESILGALSGPLFDDIDALLNRTQSGHLSPADITDLLDDILAVVLKHRKLIQFISSDSVAIADLKTGEKFRQLDSRLKRTVTFGASTGDSIRSTAAIGAIVTTVCNLPKLSERQLREPLQRAALAVLRSGENAGSSAATPKAPSRH